MSYCQKVGDDFQSNPDFPLSVANVPYIFKNVPKNIISQLKGVNQNITHAKNLTQLHTENVCAQLRDHLFLSFFEGAAFC